MYQQLQELAFKHKCMIKLAQTYYHDGEFDTAIMYCKGILLEENLDPQIKSKAYELLSDIAWARKDLTTSVNYLDQAIQNQNQDKDYLLIKKVKRLYLMGKSEQAASLFKESL